MARVKLSIPDELPFVTRLKVRITDLNYGNHLGNTAVLEFVHEARVQAIQHAGMQEHDLGGVGLVVSDAQLVYKTQGFYGDAIDIAVGVTDFNKYGCDFVYRLLLIDSGKELARAKTGIVCFDYESNSLQAMPEQTRQALAILSPSINLQKHG